MSKYVLLTHDGRVQEIIPEYVDIFPDIPAKDRYSKEFIKNCIKVKDDLEIPNGYIYNKDTKEFEAPKTEPRTRPPVMLTPAELVAEPTEYEKLLERIAKMEDDIQLLKDNVKIK